MRWLEAERGLSLRLLRRALALVGRRPRGLLGVDLGLLRGPGRRRARARARQPRDARRRAGSPAPASTTPSTSSPARTTRETAILHASELRELGELSWGELRAQVAAVAAGLRALGVEPGDRVVAYLPNIPEAIVAFLATASIGAVWSSCSPDFGPASVIDRFAQIEPKVLFAVDGYRYGGKDFDRREVLAELQEAMPSLERTVVLPYLDPEPDLGAAARRDRAGTSCSPPARAPSSPSSASPSTTRSGSSTPPAPPGCRRRSSRARAASCSST